MTEVLPYRPRPTAIVARGVVLSLTALLAAVQMEGVAWLLWLAALAVAAAPAAVAATHPRIGPLARAAEVVIAGCAAAHCASAAAIAGASSPSADTGSASGAAIAAAASAFLLYLSIPLIAAALYRRRYEAYYLSATAVAVLLVAGAAGGLLDEPGYLLAGFTWLVLGGVGALHAGTLQQALLAKRHEEPPQPYAEATRLLTQLRSVARQLPGATLDPGGLAEHLLEEIRAVAPATRAAVLSGSGGGRLVVLAQTGADRVDWETALDMESAIADAWASQQAQTSARSQTRSAANNKDVSALVLPLVAGVRTVALVALETDTPLAYPQSVISRVAGVAAPAAFRLEAALLFDEVRSIATSEERQRLAREIHDGVAQELVMVGYGIDNALAALPDAPATEDELRVLRAEVTRVITELRLSLFELRSEVDRYGGLAAAIADYARTVGATGGLRVHLSLDESTARLPTATEAELLRIAQEAITNARKHAGAENLWVMCAVDPPFAQVEVSDDGSGIGDQRPDGRYGLAIMAERAERIRGRLEIRPREPRGTTVAVVLGTAPRGR